MSGLRRPVAELQLVRVKGTVRTGSKETELQSLESLHIIGSDLLLRVEET